MHYHLTLLSRAFRLHLLRWSRYRADVAVWIVTIVITIAINLTFAYSMFQASGGMFFGYTFPELLSFFGVSLLATGLAQSTVHGSVLNLSKVVWSGNFDFWLLQPPGFFWRMLIEDMGVVWFWPQCVIGAILLFFTIPVVHWPFAFLTSLVAAAIEIGVMLCVSLPAIRWGLWSPEEGMWEYMENARLMPIGRTRNFMLWFVSFGVLHYSLALEVLTGRLSIFLLILIAIVLYLLAWLLLKLFLRSYSSASS